jgi:hypothetical protein
MSLALWGSLSLEAEEILAELLMSTTLSVGRDLAGDV